MPTIKELNKAIDTIRTECKKQYDCENCPLTSGYDCILGGDVYPAAWEDLKEGEQDGIPQR